MAIRNQFRIPVKGLAFLGFLLLFPLRGKCQTTEAEKVAACQAQFDASKPSKASEQALDALMLSGATMGMELSDQKVSLQKTQDLADTLAIAKSYLVSNLNAAKAGEASQTEKGGALTQAQQSAFNDVLSQGLADLTALQMKVAARISSLQRSIDELTARDKANTTAFEATLKQIEQRYAVLGECLGRALGASAQPPATPAKAPASNNLPGFVTNTPPAAKTSTPAKAPLSLAGAWSFDTDGGCQYQGGFVPGVNHEPDGPMQLEDMGKGKYSGKVDGEQIKSTVDGTLDGDDVLLTVRPHTYFDDPAQTPPKDPYTGGWSSTLNLKGKLSVLGNIVQGQVFLNNSTLNCTFTMMRGK